MRIEGNIDFENELKWGTTRTKALEESFKQAQEIVTMCSEENLFLNKNMFDCDSCPLLKECKRFWFEFVSEAQPNITIELYRNTIAKKLRELWVRKHKREQNNLSNNYPLQSRLDNLL